MKFKKLIDDYAVWICQIVAGFEAIRFVLYIVAFFYTISNKGIIKALTTFWKVVTAPVYIAKKHTTRQTGKGTTSKQFTRMKYTKARNGSEPQIKLEGPASLRHIKISDFED